MPEKQIDNTITSFQGRSLLQQLWSHENSCKVCTRLCLVHIRVNVLQDVDVHMCEGPYSLAQGLLPGLKHADLAGLPG